MCAEFREQRERRCALAHIAKTLNSESSRTRAARAFLHSLGFRRSVALQETNCCDNSDCRPARYRITSSGVEMLVGKTWVLVPRAMVEHRSLEGDAPFASTWSPRGAPARAALPTRHAQRCNGNPDSEVQTGSARLRPAARPHSAWQQGGG